MKTDQQKESHNKHQKSVFWTNESEKPTIGDIIDNYILEELIIETNCSFLMKAKDIRDNSLKAVKFIKFKLKHQERYRNEVELMEMIDHPNIIKLEYSLLRFPYLILVTKFAPHKNLAEFVRENYPRGMPEDIARDVMKQILDSINYLHKLNIRHRDIKPQNFLVFETEPSIKIVLADFGFAKQYSLDEKGTEYIGTELFAPPEIHLHKPYDNSVDIWPIGITLFFILTSRSPYRTCSERAAYIEKIIKGALNYRLLKMRKISIEAINIIKKMCKIDPANRLTAEALLNHPWIKKEKIKKFIPNDEVAR